MLTSCRFASCVALKDERLSRDKHARLFRLQKRLERNTRVKCKLEEGGERVFVGPIFQVVYDRGSTKKLCAKVKKVGMSLKNVPS